MSILLLTMKKAITLFVGAILAASLTFPAAALACQHRHRHREREHNGTCEVAQIRDRDRLSTPDWVIDHGKTDVPNNDGVPDMDQEQMRNLIRSA